MPTLLAAAEAAAESGFVEKFGLDVKLVIFQLVGFLIFFGIAYRFGIKPIVATMDKRNTQIADGLRYTEEMKAKLADAEKQHAAELRQGALEAQKIIDEARTTAKQLIERESQQATEKAQQIMAKAEEAIQLDRRKVMAEARGEIARLVAATASRVLNKELSADERQRYADSAAREMAEV